MNFSFLVARRYLFAKRSTNAINIITGISVFGIAVGTAALLLILSVFNGFEDLLSGLFGHFNPEIKITPAKGKTFEPDSLVLVRMREVPGVLYLSESLEEIAFFEYGTSQDFGILKGVDDNFARINNIDSTVFEGRYLLRSEDRNGVVLGAGVRNKLGINISDPVATITVYMPTKDSGKLLQNPFKTRLVYPMGSFAIQQEYDNQYVLTNLQFMRELLETSPGTVSSLEFKCKSGADVAKVKSDLGAILGDGYQIRDHYEQNEAFFKVMKLEKWMGFAITSLMLILMAFNMVGALWMIVLDKQKDISTLKSLGASDLTIRRIFLTEGLLLTGLGLCIGLALGVGIYIAQKTLGIVTVPQGFLVESYPIAMRAADFLPVIGVVLGIGLLASFAPAARAVRVPSFFREE
ncbi:MAG: ABC transporter permease [Saprospiraceae bacterium]|nr:ABC transporter permease [Saprospiraceae bacterium]